MNMYHNSLLCWSFRKALHGANLRGGSLTSQLARLTHVFSSCQGQTEKHTKRKMDMQVNCSLQSLLSCRLREGYTVNEVHLHQHYPVVEVKLSMPWKPDSLIHYVIQSTWPPVAESPCKISVYLEGDYDTLHDIICKNEKLFPSGERNLVTRKFYVTLQHLRR